MTGAVGALNSSSVALRRQLVWLGGDQKGQNGSCSRSWVLFFKALTGSWLILFLSPLSPLFFKLWLNSMYQACSVNVIYIGIKSV